MEGFLRCKHSKIENYTIRWDTYFTLKMDRKRKAVFLRLFENARKRRKAADEEIDRMIESLEDSDDDKYQEEDEDTMIGAISYASILASTTNRGGPRKKPVNRMRYILKTFATNKVTKFGWIKLCYSCSGLSEINKRISPMNQRTKEDAKSLIAGSEDVAVNLFLNRVRKSKKFGNIAFGNQIGCPKNVKKT